MLNNFLKKCANIRKQVFDALCKIESNSVVYLCLGYLLSNVLSLFLPLFTSAIFSFFAIWFFDQLLRWHEYGWNNRIEWYNINLIALGSICGVLVKL